MAATTAPMVKNSRNPEAEFAGVFCGCSCHNSKQTRRDGKHSAKRKETRRWRRDEAAQA